MERTKPVLRHGRERMGMRDISALTWEARTESH